MHKGWLSQRNFFLLHTTTLTLSFPLLLLLAKCDVSTHLSHQNGSPRAYEGKRSEPLVRERIYCQSGKFFLCVTFIGGLHKDQTHLGGSAPSP